MAYDDSERQKLYDYNTGKAFGVPYNTYSSLGAEHYLKPGVSIPQPLTSGGRPGEKVGSGNTKSPTDGMSKAERKDYYRELKRSDLVARDESFEVFLFWSFLLLYAFVDYKYMLLSHWWAHPLFVLPSTWVSLWSVKKLKLVRILRRIVMFSVFVGLLFGALWVFDVVQSTP